MKIHTTCESILMVVLVLGYAEGKDPTIRIPDSREIHGTAAIVM